MLSIVIPVFNERESLPHLWKEINHVLADDSNWEILFIDDGSSDGSLDYLADLCKNNSAVKLVQFYRNFGKSAALSEGFKHAQGDTIVTMDGDLQDDPAEIPNLINKLEEDMTWFPAGKRLGMIRGLKLFLPKYSIFSPDYLPVLKFMTSTAG